MIRHNAVCINKSGNEARNRHRAVHVRSTAISCGPGVGFRSGSPVLQSSRQKKEIRLGKTKKRPVGDPFMIKTNQERLSDLIGPHWGTYGTVYI